MKKINFKRGFTLIELLVVVAIIGILSSVVLASLNTARAKGADAATKANLSNARAGAELYYDSNSSAYTTVCTAGPNNISPNITAATNSSGATAKCYDTGTAWAASAVLKQTNQFLPPTSGTDYWCVDSVGNSKVIDTDLAAEATVCP